jgi:hypothetical protein
MNSVAIELCQQYSLGKREFYKAQLPKEMAQFIY